MRRAILAVVVSLLAVAPVAAQPVSGRAAVLTSDTFLIGSRTVQLFGVDAIEFHQFCHVNGRTWACGASATRAFQTLLDPVTVTCEPTGESNGEAMFAVCTSSEGDIAEIMVDRGWALANRDQSEDYAAAEEAAREAGEGVWRGAFVEPWNYRADIAAIERRYLERSLESFAGEAAARLIEGVRATDFFGRATTSVADRTAGGIEANAFEVRVAEYQAGIILDAIEARGVFDWRTPAAALRSWRGSVVNTIVEGAVGRVWTSFAEQPQVVIEVDDAQSYYSAMITNAAAWIEAGRQPILMVAATTAPVWIGEWFGGVPPAGSSITREAESPAPGYLGTIDGIDAYVGAASESQSYLLPGDLLLEIAYGPGLEGSPVTLAIDELPNPDAMVFTISQAIEWLNDPIVVLHYPLDAVRIEDS